MECELCGGNSSKLSMVAIDGARMMACSGCAPLGNEVKVAVPAQERKSTFSYRPSRKLEEATEVVEDLGMQVRKAREKRGLTREELAKKIFEKASVMHRIESGHYVPDDRTRRKLEKELGVRLEATE